MKEIGRFFKRGLYSRREVILTQEPDQWFDEFVALIGPTQPNGCWPWMGSYQDRQHRGTFCYEGKKWIAARLSLAFAGTPAPFVGACALHRCDNPNCVNPDHLWWGTQRENMADMAAKGRANAPKGTASPLAKLTEDQVREIRRSGEPQRIVGRRYGIDPSKVSLIRNRKAWAHVQD